MNKKKYTWKGFRNIFLFRVLLPGFFVWLTAFLLDRKIINEDRSLDSILVPLMIVLIIGTGISILMCIYYLLMMLLNKVDEIDARKSGEDKNP